MCIRDRYMGIEVQVKMDENSFSQLKTSIAKLKRERDEVMAELMKERQQLAYLDKEMNRVRVEVDYHNSNVREYEKYIGDYNRVIEESERTYGKVAYHHHLIMNVADCRQYREANRCFGIRVGESEGSR
eukprot:TRINITY_DN9993_c0_g1_i2.p1 TRINITY_DN9993_c0_g1~~TRINITY_DN9993_c0_g1_i2.p1  ORF type:complete len:129 (-),score=24.57 TRINITY_DN9993_c0_g1_i2:78-464(-)